MDRIYTGKYAVSYKNNIMLYIFVSRRLSKLMKRKSTVGAWYIPYFYIYPLEIFDSYIITGVSITGLFLVIKENLK